MKRMLLPAGAFGFLFLIVSMSVPARADGIPPGSIINSNEYKFTAHSGEWNANDFHLQIDGEFTEPPSVTGFANVSWDYDKKTNTSYANFSGGEIAPGGSVNASFKSNSSAPYPTGWFTHTDSEGKWYYDAAEGSWVLLPAGTQPGESWGCKSIGVEGLSCAFTPSGSGYLASLDILNESGMPLTASVEVYVNAGFIQHFSLSEYAALRNPRTIFTSLAVSLQPGEGWHGIVGTLDSDDDYMLALGTADNGDGPRAFALAASPVKELLALSTAKKLADGVPVITREPKAVTAGSTTYKGGYFYMQDVSRSSGIKCMPPPGFDVSRGAGVTLLGRVFTDQNAERMLEVTELLSVELGYFAKALGMTNKCISAGEQVLSSSGLLASVWGRVTEADPSVGSFTITDGGYDLSGLEPPGVTVLTNDLVDPLMDYPLVGQFVVVTGVCGLGMDPITGLHCAVLRPRGEADVVKLPLPL